MSSTLDTLLTRIQAKLSLLGGLDVQTYAQPKLVEMLQSVFNIVYDKRFWNDHRQVGTYTLDGTTGKITGDLSAVVKRFYDIDEVWLPTYSSPLPRAPRSFNPLRMYNPCFGPAGSASKVFTVYPVTTTGDVGIAYRTKPASFTFGSTVPFDEEFLINQVCGEYLIFEGANESAAKTCLGAAEKRLQDLINMEMANEFSFYSAGSVTQDQWRDA
jgi:hypothetical protein